MAKEIIEGCSDVVLEDFLVKTRPLLVHLLPEPDDEDALTVAGIVSNITEIQLCGYTIK